MPYRLEFDPGQRLFLGFSWGRLLEEEILNAFEHAAAVAPQDLNSDELILTHAKMDSSAIDVGGLQRLRDAELRLFGDPHQSAADPAKSAVYCSNSLVGLVLRLYGAMLEQDDQYAVELRFFNDLSAALAWLERDSPAFEQWLRDQADHIMGGLD